MANSAQYAENTPQRPRIFPRSCAPCRKRKSRCDRVKPCCNCVLRFSEKDCYPETPTASSQPPASTVPGSRRESTPDARERVLNKTRRTAQTPPDGLHEGGRRQASAGTRSNDRDVVNPNDSMATARTSFALWSERAREGSRQGDDRPGKSAVYSNIDVNEFALEIPSPSMCSAYVAFVAEQVSADDPEAQSWLTTYYAKNGLWTSTISPQSYLKGPISSILTV